MPKNNKRRAQLMEARKRRIIEGGPGGKSRSSDSAIVMSVPAAESGFRSRPPTPISSASSSSSSSTATSRQISVSAIDGKSRSKRKLIEFPSASHNTDPSTPVPKPQFTASTTRTIVDFSQVENLIAPLKCPQCNNSNLCLQVDEGSRKGLAVKLNVYCDICEENISSTYTSSKETSGRSPFTVNKSAVASSMLCGFGSYTFSKLCEHLDIPALHQKNFTSKAKSILNKSKELSTDLLERTAHLVRQQHAQQNGLTLEDHDDIDIAVSYDGSWMTRGHNSMIGLGCVVDVLTGYIIFHVMSTFCHKCQRTGEKRKGTSPAEYRDWYNKHKPDCDINYTGSAAMMETHADEILWMRSIHKYKLRYTTMLSDGDAKAFTRLNQIQPYPGVNIEKEECVNHVGKRMGTALRNLVSDCSKGGITVGGNGQGRLTQNVIRKLSIYYTRAIRKHSNVEDMRKAILSALYHGFSTDQRPMHHLCPTGPGSWCFFSAAIARHQKPGKHAKCMRTPLRYNLLAPHLKPVYHRLSDPKLLQRCLLGATQNANESLHAKIWRIAASPSSLP